MRRLVCGIFALYAIVVVAACATQTPKLLPPQNIGSNMVPNVPFLVQEKYQCGPASLATVLTYAGDRVTPQQVADAVYRRDLQGTVSFELGLYARKRGHRSFFGRGSPQKLINAVDQGRPAVVMVNLGLSAVRKLHYMVVTGYTPDYVVVNSGSDRSKRIAWNEFLGQWQDTGLWMLTVLPGAGK